MPADLPSVDNDDILAALTDAVTLGWLEPIPHGYCFHCHTETMVYAITAPGAPVQPPRCPACFLTSAAALLNDPAIVVDLVDRSDEPPSPR